MTEAQNSKKKSETCFENLSIRILNLFRILIFGFRIFSDLFGSGYVGLGITECLQEKGKLFGWEKP
jgi:hypothetical protein